MSDFEQMVRELHARHEIHDCLMRYARGVDREDKEMILSAYHPDAVDDHGVFVGTPNEFADWVIDLHEGAYFSQQHCLFNHYCELDGDTAHTETYYMFVAMNRRGQALSVSGGRYLDRFENREGIWRIASRVCIRDWAPLDEAPQLFEQARLTTVKIADERVGHLMNSGPHVSRDRSDVSYSRPLIVDEARLREGQALRGTASI